MNCALATGERPLFRRAILQSGPFGTVISKADAQAVGRQFRTALGKSPASATFEEMLAAQKMVLASSDGALAFAPVEVNPLRPIVAKGTNLDLLSPGHAMMPPRLSPCGTRESHSEE